MKKILVDKMPTKAKGCPFFKGYTDEKTERHKCMLLSDTLVQIGVDSCCFLKTDTSVNETEKI